MLLLITAFAISCSDPVSPPSPPEESVPTIGTELSVRISGPTSIAPSGNCGWFAESRGGTPPYTVEWYRRDGADARWVWVGSGWAYTGGMSGHSTFKLRVSVTDLDGQLASGRITVTGAGRDVCYHPDG